MQKPSPSRKRGTLATSLLLILLGALIWGGFNAALDATNTQKFCLSCHDMRATVYEDYQHSAHASNSSGVRAGCPDCHVPKEFFPKIVRKLQASTELYHWMLGTIDTPEKFAARRPYLANREWERMKQSDSRECRNCHDTESMNSASQARFAVRIHRDGFAQGKTCIDCHKGITHQLPESELEATATLDEAELRDAMEYGEEINETCAGCHGENAEGSIDGEYPRLAGMSPAYLTRQLRLFKSRDRLNIPMVPYTNDRELPEDDITAIVHYLSSIKLPTRLGALEGNIAEDGSFDALGRLEESRAVINIARYPGNVDAGNRVYRKECATCHGKQGEGSPDGVIPPLVGQHSIYIKRQIESFRKAERVHDAPEDAEIFQQFGNGEIDDILAFLSVQDD